MQTQTTLPLHAASFSATAASVALADFVRQGVLSNTIGGVK